MHLDLLTLTVIDFYMLALMTALVSHAWYRGRDRVLGYLAVFLGLATLGTLLSSLRDQLPFMLTIGLGNALALQAAACLWLTLRLFAGRPLAWLPALAGSLLWLLLCLWPDFSDNLGLRLPLYSGITATYSLLAFGELWRMRSTVPVDTRPARLLLLANGLFYLGRGLFDQGLPFAPDGSSSTLFTLLILETLLFVVSIAFVVLAMVKERAELGYRQAALSDPLTGIGNRRAFVDQAEAILAFCARQQRPVVLLLCDLDHFKQINDSHGHAAGDQALVHFSALLQGIARREDLCARIGGEEFVCLLADADLDSGLQLAERIRQALAEQPTAAGVSLSVSIGVALSGVDDYRLDMLLSRADQALYQAKARGRNRVEYHQEPRPQRVSG